MREVIVLNGSDCWNFKHSINILFFQESKEFNLLQLIIHSNLLQSIFVNLISRRDVFIEVPRTLAQLFFRCARSNQGSLRDDQ